MNWIGKLSIVLGCLIASALPPSLATARSSVANKAAATATHKKILHARSGAQQVAAPAKVASTTTTDKKHSPAKKPLTKHHGHPHRAATKSALAATATRATTEEKATPQPRAQAVSLTDGAGTNTLSRHITARSVMIMDATTGQTIYAQAPDLPGQPASTIKVLTGVISIDALHKDELVPVSQHAALMPRSKVYLSAGKKYPANDLINAVLLASANDASVALAEKIGGSEPVFAKLMTAKAKSFGATNTVCKTASGLTASGQYTTAHDLAKIFNNAMRNNQFAGKMSVTEVANTDGKIIRSHNRALWQVEGAEGGKTGYTDVARKTYVGKFKRDNDEIVVALMGSETMWEDVKKLVEYGFAAKKHLAHTPGTKNDPPTSPRMFVQLGNPPRQLPTAPSL